MLSGVHVDEGSGITNDTKEIITKGTPTHRF